MGYFSEHDISARSYWQDHSISPKPWDILLERLEILEDRLELLQNQPERYEDRLCLTDGDLRAILPEHLASVSDLRRAISLAKKDLWERHNFRLEETPEPPAVDEVTPWQLSFAA